MDIGYEISPHKRRGSKQGIVLRPSDSTEGGYAVYDSADNHLAEVKPWSYFDSKRKRSIRSWNIITLDGKSIANRLPTLSLVREHVRAAIERGDI